MGLLPCCLPRDVTSVPTLSKTPNYENGRDAKLLSFFTRNWPPTRDCSSHLMIKCFSSLNKEAHGQLYTDFYPIILPQQELLVNNKISNSTLWSYYVVLSCTNSWQCGTLGSSIYYRSVKDWVCFTSEHDLSDQIWGINFENVERRPKKTYLNVVAPLFSTRTGGREETTTPRNCI